MQNSAQPLSNSTNLVKDKQSEAGGALPQKSAKAVIDTRQELAKIANVSHDTIAKVKTRSPELAV